MPYRFKPNKKPAKGFRRIVAEQVDIALASLPDAGVANDSVHAGRKALKRLRAVVGCAAPALGQRHARAHETALRDIARLLAHRRDSDVALETLAVLESSSTDEAAPAFAVLRADIQNRRGAGHGAVTPETIHEVRQRLSIEGARLRAARFKSRGMSAILSGVADAYRHGRHAFKIAYRSPSDENVHALRKAVQRHWRHMALLSRAWPEAFAVRIDEARILSQLLGDDHDLAILKHAASALPTADRAAVVGACAVRQSELRMRARPRLERLFAEKPAAFEDRITSYWRTGARMQKLGIDNDQPQSQSAPGSTVPTDTAHD